MIPKMLSDMPVERKHILTDATIITLLSLILVLVVLAYLLGVYASILALVVISLRYQLLARIHGFNAWSGGMMLEDKFVNEYQYQIKKRGYKIKFFNIGSDFKLDFKTDAPIHTKKWCKLLTFVAMIVSPGWNYRELDDEESTITVNTVEEAKAVEL